MIGPFRGQYRFLSNFYAHPVIYEGRRYKSAEHAFQAEKLGDLYRGVVMSASTPAAAKRIGRRFPPRPDWDRDRVEVMEQIIRAKFSDENHLDMADLLRGTGEELLAEVNTWDDTFWGITDKGGQNNLGLILMRVRRDLLQAVTK